MTVSAFPIQSPVAETLADTVSPWGSPSQRVAQRRNKYDALLATAARLFKQQGFACTSLDQVAAQLGITKPTLYYYVRSKDELVHACAMAGLERAQASVERALAAVPQVDTRSAALKAYATAVASDFGWCMVRVTEYAQPAHCRQQASLLRKTLEQCLGTAVSIAGMPVAVMLRALEGVVLSLPRTQWASLIDQWAMPTVPRVAAAPAKAVAPAAKQVPTPALAPVALQAAAAAPQPSPISPVPLHAQEKPDTEQPPVEKKVEQQPKLTRSRTVVKKATNRSVVAARPAPAIDQISLF